MLNYTMGMPLVKSNLSQTARQSSFLEQNSKEVGRGMEEGFRD